MVDRERITPLKDDWAPRRDDREVTVQAAFDERVTLIYYYPGMHPDIIDALVDCGYRGIVVAGTGLGHVNRLIYPALERARDAGVQVYMTLQTLWGFVQMHVYETGREILELGVVPLANMIPEVAYIKLGWALGPPPGRPGRREEAHDHQRGRGDDGAGAPRRVPHLPGRGARGAGLPGEGSEIRAGTGAPARPAPAFL